MKLLERLNMEQPGAVIKYLESLDAGEDVRQLESELTEKDISGMTALHLAIKRGELDLVRCLLDVGAPVGSRSAFGDVENYALECAKANQFNKKHLNVYALVKSRAALDRLTVRECQLPFSHLRRFVSLIESNNAAAKGRLGIVLLGLTGVGKSTLLNFLCGVDYRPAQVKGKIKGLQPLQPERVKTGSQSVSVTTFPAVEPLPGLPFSMVDLPGFEDTRGSVVEISAAASVCALVKQLKAIQEVWLVMPWSALADSRMTQFRRATEQVGAILDRPGSNYPVTLVITQFEQGLQENDVRERLQTLAQDEGWDNQSQSQIFEPTSSTEVRTSDVWRRQCLKQVTQAILARSGNILLMDVINGQTRAMAQKYFSSLTRQAELVESFNFQHYSTHVTRFRQMLQTILGYFAEVDLRLKQLLADLQSVAEQLQQKNSVLKDLENKQSQQQQEQGVFDQSYHTNVIDAFEQELLSIKEQYDNWQRLKEEYQQRIRQTRDHYSVEIVSIQSRIDDLEWRNQHLQKKINDLQSKNQPRKVLDSDDIDLHDFFPILRTMGDPRPGREREQRSVQAMETTQAIDRSQEELRNNNIQLGRARASLHEAQGNLQRQVDDLEQSQSDAQRNMTNCRDRLRDFEFKLVEARQALKNAQADHEAKMKVVQSQLKDLELSLQQEHAEREKLLNQKSDLQRELDVLTAEKWANSDLLHSTEKVRDVFDSNKPDSRNAKPLSSSKSAVSLSANKSGLLTTSSVRASSTRPMDSAADGNTIMSQDSEMRLKH